MLWALRPVRMVFARQQRARQMAIQRNAQQIHSTIAKYKNNEEKTKTCGKNRPPGEPLGVLLGRSGIALGAVARRRFRQSTVSISNSRKLCWAASCIRTTRGTAYNGINCQLRRARTSCTSNPNHAHSSNNMFSKSNHFPQQTFKQ